MYLKIYFYMIILVSLTIILCPLRVICSNPSNLTLDGHSSDDLMRLDVNVRDGCSSFTHIPNGNITLIQTGNERIMHFSCLPGFHLTGRPKIICESDNSLPRFNDGFEKPVCNRACLKPPMLPNGDVVISGQKDNNEQFFEGVVADYECMVNFKLYPTESQRRICRQGEWTGERGICVFEGCPRIRGIINGYFVVERKSTDDIMGKEAGLSKGLIENEDAFKDGDILRFKCNNGYTLVGTSLTKCVATGVWQPHMLPRCRKGRLDANNTIGSPYYPSSKVSSITKEFGHPPSDDGSCSSLFEANIVQVYPLLTSVGSNAADVVSTIAEGTVIEVTCAFGYRDKVSPCQPELLRCDNGRWIGKVPVCVKVDDCVPSKILHGQYESMSGEGDKDRFGVGGQVLYSCMPGYQLVGDDVVTCQIGGCWEPNTRPICEARFYLNSNWPEHLNLNTNTSLLFSVVTAMSVLFVLMSVCIAVVCRHRPSTSLHHHHSSAPAAPALVPPPPDPDRVALIAFADGIQSGLPTYEEAVRGNGGRGLLSYRLHHPPWAQRRNPRTDTTIIARQLSSTGDSMGSTDTMTVSDVSTNVTLDTVSSHTCSSTSQTASCRAICGSLASFDTSSVLNTEGVPLLEENELEENVANIDVDDNCGPQACDNTSFKLQSDIDSIHS